MLLDFDHGGRVVTTVPYQAEYQFWRRSIGVPACAAIEAEIHRMLNSGSVHTTSWMPGANWSGTPFDPIYQAIQDEICSAKCFGLFVWDCVLQREHEVWGSGHYEKDGYPIKGRTYFILHGARAVA